MTTDEFRPIAEALVLRWPQVNWDERVQNGVLGQLGADLADLDAGQVAAAVDALARDAREWPPLAGQIRAAVVELAVDAPPWGEVRRIIDRALRGVLHPDPAEARQLQARALEGMAPLIAGFVRQVGWNEFRRTGDIAEAQVREKWTAYLRRAERDLRYHGLPSAGLPALERINSQPRQLGEAVRRALPLRAVDDERGAA